jgi:GDP-4-dehydro-6-deoxy-D-mannose reductase
VRALVTGADGFVGRWLIEHLGASGDDVWRATGGRGRDTGQARSCDLAEPGSAADLIEWASPEAIYHLAAVAFAPDAATDIGRAIDVTVRGTAYLLEAASRAAAPPSVFIPSSAAVYGEVSAELVTESHPVAPVSLYGATKAAQEILALSYHRSARVQVAVARAFNHIGPGQRPSFVVPSFAAQLAQIAAGNGRGTIQVGDVSVERDFTDVRDVVRAYRLIVAGSHFGEPINVASGESTSVRTILDRLISVAGVDVEVVVDPARLRSKDARVVRGSAERLRSLTGWRPEHTLESTIGDVWDEARRAYE